MHALTVLIPELGLELPPLPFQGMTGSRISFEDFLLEFRPIFYKLWRLYLGVRLSGYLVLAELFELFVGDRRHRE